VKRNKNRVLGIRNIGQAIAHARATGTFDGVHPNTISYAARQGYALPNPQGAGWVLTDKGRAYRRRST
jgi:hypothetical protein